jgi:flagellar protein FlbD
MIILTTLSGERIGLNPDLVQRAEGGHPTAVLLLDGTRYDVAESLDAVADQLLAYRIAIVSGTEERRATLHVVR